MEKKIIGILVAMLLIGTALSSLGMTNKTSNYLLDSEVLDQENDFYNYYVPIRDADDGKSWAQSFTPTISPLSRIEVLLISWNVTYPISIHIRKDKDGEDLASISEIIKFEGSYDGWYSFDFEDMDVDIDEPYYILIASKQPWDNASYGWFGNWMNTYEGGNAWYVNNGEWYPRVEDDFCFRSYGMIENEAPLKPETPSGPSSGNTGTLYTYTSNAIDPDNDEIHCLWDWGDGTDSGWLGPYNSGDICEQEHSWPSKGNYNIKVKAKDKWEQESDWSDPLVVSMPKTHNLDLIKLIHNNPFLMKPLEKLLSHLKINMGTTDDTEYWGLLIAVGEYLNNPNQDRPSMLVAVENMYQSLHSSDNWEPSHIRKIKGENANLENILEGFKWLLQMEDENDISLVYITTHGGYLNSDYPPKDETDGKDEILIPYEGFDDTSKFLWDDEINFFLNLLQSKGVCFIVDSCHSGGFNDAYIKTKDDAFSEHWINDFLDDLNDDFGRVILMSCEESELSYGSDFSYYIAQGFEGEADKNHDNICTAEETFEYVQPIVENMGMQHPTMVDTYDGELPLTTIG